MKFSIVLIAYNCQSLTSLAIKSLRQQEYPVDSFEVILIDDGSTPPISIDKEIAHGLNFQSYYIPRSENSCRARARNIGASKSIYDWIIFIDGDQYANPFLIDKYYQYLLATPNTQMLSGTRIELTDWQSILLDKGDIQHLNRVVSRQKDIRWQLIDEIEKGTTEYKNIWSIFWSHNFLISKELFLQLKGFDENFKAWGCEDTEFAYRVEKTGTIIKIIENPVYNIFFEKINFSEKYKEYIINYQYFYKKYYSFDIILYFSFYEKTFFHKKKLLDFVDEFNDFSKKVAELKFIH